jgi:gas vesicle protein
MDISNSKIVRWTVLVIAGAVLSASLALLFAPNSGKELRNKISKSTCQERQKISSEMSKIGRSFQAKLDKAIDLFKILCDQIDDQYCGRPKFF